MRVTARRLTSPSVVRALLREHGVNVKKRFGQNFLIDQNILEKIVAAAELRVEDTVLEIGPGVGALTEALAQKAGAVVAVEIDDQLLPLLRQVLAPYENVRLIHGDALRIDWSEALGPVTSLKIVANLPYYITSPLIMGFLESTLPIQLMVLMVQAEVAERLAAVPGSKAYGALTVAVQYRAEVRRIAKVPRTVFYPQPNVDSAVVALRIRPYTVQAADEEVFSTLVRSAFAQRRKTLRKALMPLAGEMDFDVEELLQSAGIDPSLRGESLAVDSYVALANAIVEVKSRNR